MLIPQRPFVFLLRFDEEVPAIEQAGQSIGDSQPLDIFEQAGSLDRAAELVAEGCQQANLGFIELPVNGHQEFVIS
jgi:hypothetical protein